MSNIFSFEGYISVPVIVLCFGLGVVIKSFLPKIKNDYIPGINVIFGIIVEFILSGISPESAVIGIVSGFASTGAYELIKNSINLSVGNEEEK